MNNDLARMLRIAALIVLASSCAEKREAAHENVVEVNEAPPAVILARLCSYLPDEELCTVPEQAAAFHQLINTYRGFEVDPLFETAEEFLDFVEGRGEAYASLGALLGEDNPLLSWTPVMIGDEFRADVASAFKA